MKVSRIARLFTNFSGGGDAMGHGSYTATSKKNDRKTAMLGMDCVVGHVALHSAGFFCQ
jgi:hypothetical protein